MFWVTNNPHSHPARPRQPRQQCRYPDRPGCRHRQVQRCHRLQPGHLHGQEQRHHGEDCRHHCPLQHGPRQPDRVWRPQQHVLQQRRQVVPVVQRLPPGYRDQQAGCQGGGRCLEGQLLLSCPRYKGKGLVVFWRPTGCRRGSTSPDTRIEFATNVPVSPV